jgi:arylsulfatase A-like enzyme
VAQTSILLIYADQHRYDCVGSNGHPFLETPHLDRLAREGMNFTHAFCPIPLCMPARNSLLHGQWPVQHQNICNDGTEAPRPPDPGLPTFLEALRAAGYFLGHVGKWHVNPARGPLEYGFDEDIPETAYPAWRAAHGAPTAPEPEDWFGALDAGIEPNLTRPAWGAEQVIAMLTRLARHDRPFYIAWELSEPHLPNVLPEPYYSRYPPEVIPPWPSYPDPLIGKPYVQSQQRRSWRVEDTTWPEWARLVSAYLGMLSLVDAQIGRVLDALDGLGLAEQTLVVYTADHGDLCGGHGMLDKHMVMYEDVVHVPLIVRWPGHISAGSRCGDFISNGLDLAPTFCQVAGAPIPATFTGRSLVPLLKGTESAGREDILAMYHGNQFGLFSQRMVRDRRWKYVWNPAAEDELYDLETDPGEIRNRAADPACRAELARLRLRLVAWMEEIGDPLLNSWTRVQLVEGRKI